MKKKMSSKKSSMSSSKVDDIGVCTSQILKLLKVNPTTKFVIKKTGRDRRLVAKDIKKLINKGYIKRIDRGLYNVIPTRPHSMGDKQENDLRLHGLEIELLMNGDNFKIIKNTVLKNKQYYNVRGDAHSSFFDCEVTGQLTKDKIFMYFPKDWEVRAKSKKDLVFGLYDAINDTVLKWEQKFKLMLFKDGRINFNIRKIHIAFEHNGIAEEIKKDINYLTLYDSEDGKLRTVIDMSKGFPELEAVHSEKALNDSDEIKFVMEAINEGKLRKIIQEENDIRTILAQNHFIMKSLLKPLMDEEKKVSEPKDEKLANYFG